MQYVLCDCSIKVTGVIGESVLTAATKLRLYAAQSKTLLKGGMAHISFHFSSIKLKILGIFWI